MPSADAYLAHLTADDGYVEAPTNRTKFAARAGHLNGYAWCATFLVAGARDTGLALPPGVESAYTPTQEAAFKRAGRLHTTPQRGDFGFIYFAAQGVVGHVFAVLGVRGNLVDTVEGNTNGAGSANGGMVARRTRTFGHRGSIYVRSFGRPDYTTSSTAPHEEDDMFSDADRNWLRDILRRTQSMHQGNYLPVAVDPGEVPAPHGDLTWLDEKITLAVREGIDGVLADVGEKVWDRETIAVQHPISGEAQTISMRLAAGRAASVVRDTVKAGTTAGASQEAIAAAIATAVPRDLADQVLAALGARLTPTPTREIR